MTDEELQEIIDLADSNGDSMVRMNDMWKSPIERIRNIMNGTVFRKLLSSATSLDSYKDKPNQLLLVDTLKETNMAA